MESLTRIEKKRISPTNMFVTDCITTALFDLLKNKPMEDITITEIINRAGVSRMGFYRNYTSKEDIIEKFIFKCFFETIDEIEQKRSLNFNVPNIMQTTLEKFKQYADYTKILLDRNMDAIIHRCYEMGAMYLANRQNKSSKIREYSVCMFIGEILSIELCWLRNGMKESPKQLAKIYYKLLSLHAKAK